ncbi:hypothetical protein Tco_0992880 [Tanacetum coccineum]|uniref:Uncharacterized protein n=1 Tax=Tanacetum coccineum TaxID=301880 RepID=A0ABQ5F3D0_9ASTR
MVQTSFLNVKWRLLASLQALFLKVKKGVRLQRKGEYCNPIFRQKENVRVSAFILNIEKRNLFGLELLSKHSMFVSSSRWLSYSSVRIQFFKEKESVRFSALYLQKKRNLLRSLLHDNIIPKPDLALELGKSISLTEAEEEAVAREVHATHARIVSGPDPEPVQEDQTGSNSGKLHVSLAGPNPEHMDDEFLATAYPKEKSKVIEESDSTIPDPSHQTVTSNLPVIAPFTDVSSTKPSSLVTPPPINTEATKWRTKLDDALLKILERHTADLIEKYSALPGPESIKNQESEKSPKEIIRIKREQGEEKQDSTYSIRSTDKVALEEFDLKSALFKHMNKNKTANRNPANYHLYHALMEALIADEDAMDKEVAVKVKDHKRKHDSDDEEDDDDDEGPSAGSNQGSEPLPLLSFTIIKTFLHWFTPPPINIEATTITPSLPEITPFIALQLRVARLEQEMSEVKKSDHSTNVLASIKSQVPTAIDKYLGIKLHDALPKNQESKKSPKEIIRIKREQGEEKQLGSQLNPSIKLIKRRHDSGASGSAQPPTKDDEQSSKKPRKSDASASKQHPALPSTRWIHFG